jgi:hypothetical protein
VNTGPVSIIIVRQSADSFRHHVELVRGVLRSVAGVLGGNGRRQDSKWEISMALKGTVTENLVSAGT